MLDSTRTSVAMRDPAAPNGIPSYFLSYFLVIAEQYRKTVVSTQLLIGVITLSVALQTHRWVDAFAFFTVMQFGAVFGAMWVVRLRSRIDNPRRLNKPRA
jgi:hypothetical protein